jgi:uncharacterized protein with PQ loop repeat
MNIEILGWLASALLSICGLPQAIQSFKQKHSHGLSWGFIALWGFGELFQIIYVIIKMQPPIIFNAFLNLVIIFVIVYFKIYPKKLDLNK